MSVPIVAQISANVKATLDGITTINGYTYTLKAERFKRLGQQPKHLLCVLRGEDPQLVGERPQQHREWRKPYTATTYVILSEQSSEVIDDVLDTVNADIEKALMVDLRRGNFAIRTEIEAPNFTDDVKGAISAVTSNFSVHYRTLWNDPYSG